MVVRTIHIVTQAHTQTHTYICFIYVSLHVDTQLKLIKPFLRRRRQMASIVMFLRALMSCRLTPKDEPETASWPLKPYRNVPGDEYTTRKRIAVVDVSRHGDNHEFIIKTTRGINDMDEGFNWIIVKNHLMWIYKAYVYMNNVLSLHYIMFFLSLLIIGSTIYAYFTWGTWAFWTAKLYMC